MMGLDSIWQDLRFGLRQLRRSPGFTAAVVGVLALGIGANAAMFTVLGGTVLRSMPYRAPQQLLTMEALNGKGDSFRTNVADILDWRAHAKTLDSVGYYTTGEAVVEAGGGEQDVSKGVVSTNLFSVLGVTPKLGRGFTADEQVPGKGNVAVLSERVWREKFAADPGIVGRVVKIDDAPMTVIGVMPAHFEFPVDEKLGQVWVPSAPEPKDLVRNFSAASFKVVARMRPDVTEGAVHTEVSGLQAEIAKLYPADLPPMLSPTGVRVEGYRAGLIKEQRSGLLALMGAVGMVWLIACANVANLMLARSTARRREMAVRGALGASAWRLVRQMMAESLLLSAGGALAGAGLAWVTLVGFRKALATSLGTDVAAAPDLRVLLALGALSLVSALVFGVAPAVMGAKVPLDQTLRSGGAQAGMGRGQHRVQRGLMVAEIGLSLAMLVACGLMLRTVFALQHVPLGFRTDHVFVVTPKLPHYKYKGGSASETVYKPLLERVKTMHGVQAAALTTTMPLAKGFGVHLALNMAKFGTKTSKSNVVTATLKAAGPELQKVLGFEMARGRYFNAQDTPGSQPVIVVNEAFAKIYEPESGPVEGFTLGTGGENGPQAKIVGVVKDFHQMGIADAAMPEIDVCASQMKPGTGFYQPTMGVKVQLAIRTSGDAKGFAQDLTRVMQEVNPDLRASEIQTMDQVVEDSMASQLLAAHLLEALGVLALGVALAGLYSLLAYLVTLRTREFGVRMALGAAREDILSLVMGQAGWMVAGGLGLGVVVSLATTRLLGHFLFGVKARDVGTVVVAAVLMFLVAAVAAFIPARRASGIEPMEALRTE